MSETKATIEQEFSQRQQEGEAGREFDDAAYQEIMGIMSNINHGHDYTDSSLMFTPWSEEELTEFCSVLQKHHNVIIQAYRQPSLKEQVLRGLEELTSIPFSEEESMARDALTRFAIDVIDDLKDSIEEDIEQSEHSQVAGWGIDLICDLVKQGSKRQRGAGLGILSKHISLFKEELEDEKKYYTAAICLNTMMVYGNAEQVKEAADILVGHIQQDPDGKWVPKLVGFLFQGNKTEEFRDTYGKTAVKPIFEQFGLPPEIFFSAWMKSGDDLEYPMRKNIDRIREVEKQQPGACRVLYDEFGIADFGRYPTDLLCKQYEERNDTTKPYGVIVYPRNDYNGAYYLNSMALDEFYKATRGSFSLRAVECATKYNVAHALYDLDKKYNPKDKKGHKISLAIIGGHGTENSIQFGGTDKRHLLTSEDLKKRNAKGVDSFLEENSTIILASCSTGADGGIGQELSKMLGAKVLAPKVRSVVLHYRATQQGRDKWEFDVEYRLEDADQGKAAYIKGSPVV
ncbi:MAG: hypothetical protein WC817_00040 [Patescibacteria group bacterium]|jgi:hypothetical protein